MSRRRQRAPRADRPATAPPRHDATPEPRGAPRWLVAGGLFVVFFAIYVTNFRVFSSGDAIPTRLLPISIVRDGNLDLDEFTWLSGGKKAPYYVRVRQGHLYSASTIATALVVTPLYAIPFRLLGAENIALDDVRARLLIVVMERISAALLTALSATALFLVLTRLVTQRWALVLTATYALGTSTWSISSQALWPHALSDLSVVAVSAVLLARAPSRMALAFAGVMSALAVANRPQMIGFALLALLFVWRHQRRDFLAFVSVPLAGAALVLAYNLSFFGSLWGGYGKLKLDYFSSPLLIGLAGLLASPSRGLFVYTPIMLFGFWGAVQVFRRDAPPWMRYLVVALAVHLVVHAKFREWWGGYAFGPRYLADMLPVLILLLVYGLVPWCRTPAARAIAAILILYGVIVQAIGVYCDDDGWNRQPIALERQPQRLWDWSDPQLVRAARSGWHGTELWPLLRESLMVSEPVRLVDLRDKDLAADIHLIEAPKGLVPSGRGQALAEITNRGEHGWPAFSGDIRVRRVVMLVVRWLAGENPVPAAGDVLKLPENLLPGKSVQMEIPLIAPGRPGDYQVELRIVQALDGTRGVSSNDPFRFPVKVGSGQ